MTNKQKIYKYIEEKGPVRPGDILKVITIGEQMLYRHLKRLLEEKKIEKIGTSPRVFYSVIKNNSIEINFEKEINDILEKEFYFISPAGRKLQGIRGFIFWCQKRNFDIQKKAGEFVKIYKKYQKIRKNGLLNATPKLKKAFDFVCVDKLFYYDFYSIEIFGKTKIGQKLLYAKQSQDKEKIIEISKMINKSIKNIIKKEKIDSVVFVPPTVPRKIQFMKILESSLELNLPKIEVLKVILETRVPQKTLKRIEDRIENAENTFVINEKVKFKNTLIIDDAVGSGASINQISCKLKKNRNSKKTIGFAITGSLNNFDVISEV